MLSDMYRFFSTNILVILIAQELVALAFFLYFFIIRRNGVYCKFYWQGFFLISIGTGVALVQRLFSFGSWKFNLIKIPLLCAAAVLVTLGAKRYKQERKVSRRKHE